MHKCTLSPPPNACKLFRAWDWEAKDGPRCYRVRCVCLASLYLMSRLTFSFEFVSIVRLAVIELSYMCCLHVFLWWGGVLSVYFFFERYLWSFRPLTRHFLPALFVLIASCAHVQ